LYPQSLKGHRHNIIVLQVDIYINIYIGIIIINNRLKCLDF